MAAHVIDFLTLGDNFSTAEMRIVWSEKNRLKKQVKVEVALAEAEGALGVIPEEIATIIKSKATHESIILEELSLEIKKLKHSFMATINHLQSQCGDAGEYIHYGATTQDIVDTATILQLKEAYKIIWRDVQLIAEELKILAKKYELVPMVGRTHGMQALPTTFGFKVAVWLDEFIRHLARLYEMKDRIFVGNINGAVGTYASLGQIGIEVERKTLELLDLQTPNISWQSARDRFSEYASIIALISGSLGKIGNEFYNLMRTEINEVEEPFTSGKIGSSTMPHKRNPAVLEGIVSLTAPIYKSVALIFESMKVEHERDAMSWRAEWIALPEINLYISAQLQSMLHVLRGLKVNTEQMKKNLHIQQGLLLSEKVMFELASVLGKQTAHAIIYDCAMYAFENNKKFKDVLLAHKQWPQIITAEMLSDFLDPFNYLGGAVDKTNDVIQFADKSGLLERKIS